MTGNLLATPAESSANPNEAWRNYTKRVFIAACKFGNDDLKRLYKLINDKQTELCKRLLAGLSQLPEETPEIFQGRYARVKNAFITTITITGTNGEVVTGHGEAFFDSPQLPERIESILYDTTFSPKCNIEIYTQ